MAESSLDDFFAKKDKSKKKPKTKSGAVGDEDLAKSKQKDKKKKDKEKQNSSGGTISSVLSNQQEDEEWKDFEEEKKIDYTGLRIQTLQISKEEQDRDGVDSLDNGDDEDENRDRRDGSSGPWNKSGNTSSAAPALASQTEPAKKEEPAPRAPSKYIPPAQRQGAVSASSSANFPSSRKKKEAPNVHSEEDFPTLGGNQGSGRGQSPHYISTASSDLIDNPHQRRGINLTLENKFSALQD